MFPVIALYIYFLLILTTETNTFPLLPSLPYSLTIMLTGAAYSSTVVYDISSLLGLSSVASAQDFTASMPASDALGNMSSMTSTYPPAPVELDSGVKAMAKQPIWLQRQR